MQKKRLFLITAIAMMLMVFVPVAVLAQGGPSYSSAYQVQNLESEVATVQVQYYKQDGTMAASGSFTIDGNKSATVFPFVRGDNVTPDPGTFNGSAVLASDRQIAAILNTQTAAGTSPFYGASTAGFSAGATEISLPLIVCNNAGFNTWFNVQAVGTGPANVTVEYIKGSHGNTGVSETAVIQQYAAKTFNQASGSTDGTKTCADLAPAAGKFIGSAKVTSTNGQPIVASAMFLGTGNYKTLQGYNGFTSGSTSINMPLVMSYNSTFYTAIQIQNAGDNDANVVVTFGTSNGVTPSPETFVLAPGGSKTLIQSGGKTNADGSSPSNDWNALFGATKIRYVSGATITQDGTSENLVAVVNQNSTEYTALGSTYQGFAPTSAASTVNLPLIAANNSGFRTGIQILAVTGDPTVTVAYSANTESGALKNPINDTKTLSTNESWTIIQADNSLLSGANNWTEAAAGKYVGSAKVTATGGTVVAIVNFNGSAAIGDTFFTYEGFGQ